MDSVKKSLYTHLARGRGTYAAQACARCRSKKVRCDGKRPICSTCQFANSECSWSKDGTPVSKKTTNEEEFLESPEKQSESDALKEQIDALREYSAFLKSEIELCELLEHGEDPDRDYMFRLLAGRKNILEYVNPTNDGDQEDGDMHADRDRSILITEGLTGGGLTTYGNTSAFRFRSISVQEVSMGPWRFQPAGIITKDRDSYVLLLDGVDESQCNLDLDWARYLPKEVPLDRRGHDKALDLLFKFQTPWCLPVIPPLFLRDMVRVLSAPKGQTPPKTNHYSPMLHNALLALGLAFLDDPAVRDYKARRHFAEEAKHHMETEWSKASTCSVNALATIATFHSSRGNQLLGTMYFGMAARMSQILILEGDLSEQVKADPIGRTDDVLDRYWMYWTAWAQEVNWSLHSGRDFCLQAPSESEFREMRAHFVDSELDQLQFTHPGVSTQRGLLSKTFVATCELLVVARRIMNIANGIEKTGQLVSEEVISEIDLELNIWKLGLDVDVDLAPSNKFAATPHKLMLHVVYWWQFILLHTPYLQIIHGSDKKIDHGKLCCRAAEHIMDLLAVWKQLYTLRYCPVNLVQPLFAAGTIFFSSGIHAISGIRPAQQEMKTFVDSIEVVMQSLCEIGKSWKCALDYEAILRVMLEEHLKPAIEKGQNAGGKDGLALDPDTELLLAGVTLPAVPWRAAESTQETERVEGDPQVVQSSTSSDPRPQKSQVVYRVACLTANDALEHLRLRQGDISRAMDNLDIPVVALAGFNEGLVQQGMAALLQEIHIVLSKDLALPQHVLDAVGKACSPFPSMIFMPSGATCRPPVFDAEGKTLTFEDLIPPSSPSQPRFNIALEQRTGLVAHGSTEQGDQSSGDNSQDGQNRGDQGRRSPTDANSGSIPFSRITGRNSHSESQPEEDESSDDEIGAIPPNIPTGEDENHPAANARGGEHMESPQGPPVPGDDGTTQQPHNIHFDITAAIYQPSPECGLLQKLQLTGDFNFKISPGRTSSVDFTQMQCQAHSNPGASYRYSQTYLKILIDSYSPRWRLSKHKPKSTRASDGQVKRIESDKTAWQQAVKAGLSLIPFGAPVKVEGSLTHTGERLTSNEAVRFSSRIIQRQNMGVFWWSFHVDDDHEAECGVELVEDSLPSAQMSVLPSASTPPQPLDRLSVEITSFWSLLRKESGGWFSYNTPGDSLPPGFSNLCQVICIDLPPGDGNYVAEMQVGAPGKPEQESTVHSQSAITPAAAVLMFSGGVQSVDGLVDAGKRLIGA